MTLQEFKEMLDDELEENKVHYGNDIYEMLSRFKSDDRFLDLFSDYLIEIGKMLIEFGEMLDQKEDIFH